KQRAWADFLTPIREQIGQATSLCSQTVYEAGQNAQAIAAIVQELNAIKEPIRKDVMQTVRKVLGLCPPNGEAVRALRNFYDYIKADNKEKFSSHLHSESRHS